MSTKKQEKKVQGAPKMRSPPLVFVRKVRGGISANDARPFFFFSSPLASASRTVWAQKKARSGPSGRHVKGTLEIRSPPLVFVRKVRGGVSAKDATRLLFFFSNSRGEERAEKPLETRNMSRKKRKKKKKNSPKMRSPPLVFVRKVRGEISANDATIFFFFSNSRGEKVRTYRRFRPKTNMPAFLVAGLQGLFCALFPPRIRKKKKK